LGDIVPISACRAAAERSAALVRGPITRNLPKGDTLPKIIDEMQ
jgi:hypothetical protein